MSTPDHVTLAPGYARYHPRGPATAGEAIAALFPVIAWCRQAGIPKLLTDARGIEGLTIPTTLERFQLGEEAARQAEGEVHVAMVVPERVIDPQRFGMMVAQNRGLRANVFTDEVSALDWLAGPKAVRPVLATDRLALRWLTIGDTPFILPLTTQPSWLRNIGDRGVRDLPTAEAYILKGPRASYAARGFGLWCMERTEDGTPVGICGIIKRDSMEHPELAYAVLEKFHGQGYASEAALATVRYAEEALGIARLAAIVNPENRPSIRILEKAGMQYEGPITMPGETQAISLYGRWRPSRTGVA